MFLSPIFTNVQNPMDLQYSYVLIKRSIKGL